jgi:hypothetical protein
MSLLLWAVPVAAVAVVGGVSIMRYKRIRGRRLYKHQLEQALADGILTEEETRQLASVRAEEELSEAEVRMVALSLYRRALRDAEADSRITEEESEQLTRLRAQLGLSDRDLRGDHAQLQRIRVLAEVEREHLPHIEAPVQLAGGEACYWVVQARLGERLAVPGRKSELRHISFDVAAGTPFSAAGERSELRTSDEMLPIDMGVVVITDRRTLFRGARRTVAVPHMKLQSIDLYQDAIAIEETDPARRNFLIVDDPELTAAVLLTAARIRRRDVSGLTTRTA